MYIVSMYNQMLIETLHFASEWQVKSNLETKESVSKDCHEQVKPVISFQT